MRKTLNGQSLINTWYRMLTGILGNMSITDHATLRFAQVKGLGLLVADEAWQNFYASKFYWILGHTWRDAWLDGLRI